ncbi:MAG: transposase [Sphaerobacter sp.]|nr:transposase [Sphaerobacter sp.]
MMGDRPQRKRIRSPADVYRVPHTQATITLGVAGRRPVFADAAFTSGCLDILRERAERDGIEVLAYCSMPDHLHLLLEVVGDTSLIDFIRAFKGRTTRIAWNHGVQGSLWQRSFYDHIVRREEDTDKHLR